MQAMLDRMYRILLLMSVILAVFFALGLAHYYYSYVHGVEIQELQKTVHENQEILRALRGHP